MKSETSYLCKTALKLKGRINVMISLKRCRYYKESSKVYDFKKLTAGGLCIHAFHSVYSSCLRLLYTQDKNNIKTSIVCPNVDDYVEFEVVQVKYSDVKQRILNTLKYYLRKIGVPCDYLMHQVFIKVTSVNKHCLMNHQVGDTFEFNLGQSVEICPASFESLYPVIYSLNLQNQFKQDLLEDNESLCLVCPSHMVNIKYHISEY